MRGRDDGVECGWMIGGLKKKKNIVLWMTMMRAPVSRDGGDNDDPGLQIMDEGQEDDRETDMERNEDEDLTSQFEDFWGVN